MQVNKCNSACEYNFKQKSIYHNICRNSIQENSILTHEHILKNLGIQESYLNKRHVWQILSQHHTEQEKAGYILSKNKNNTRIFTLNSPIQHNSGSPSKSNPKKKEKESKLRSQIICTDDILFLEPLKIRPEDPSA